MKKENFKNAVITALRFVANPRFLLCFGIGWMITNGWSYVLFIIGTYFKIGWMVGIASAYLTFLWLPISAEKIITLTIAILLMQRFFPNDKNTLEVLKKLYNKAKSTVGKKKKNGKNADNNKTQTPQ
ncbi:MAG: hypothetical protein IJO29_04150 [Oscillospiraceae bacterium]|nr:hypothetical protein [Oscillospiraceae bacterium]